MSRPHLIIRDLQLIPVSGKSVETGEPVITVTDFLDAMDQERRRMRNNVISLLVFAVITIVPIRIGVDFALDLSVFKDVQHLRKYAVIIPFIMFVSICSAGIYTCFSRRYPKPKKKGLLTHANPHH